MFAVLSRVSGGTLPENFRPYVSDIIHTALRLLQLISCLSQEPAAVRHGSPVPGSSQKVFFVLNFIYTKEVLQRSITIIPYKKYKKEFQTSYEQARGVRCSTYKFFKRSNKIHFFQNMKHLCGLLFFRY